MVMQVMMFNPAKLMDFSLRQILLDRDVRSGKQPFTDSAIRRDSRCSETINLGAREESSWGHSALCNAYCGKLGAIADVHLVRGHQS